LIIIIIFLKRKKIFKELKKLVKFWNEK
jgi:hypothetical protein